MSRFANLSTTLSQTQVRPPRWTSHARCADGNADSVADDQQQCCRTHDDGEDDGDHAAFDWLVLQCSVFVVFGTQKSNGAAGMLGDTAQVAFDGTVSVPVADNFPVGSSFQGLDHS